MKKKWKIMIGVVALLAVIGAIMYLPSEDTKKDSKEEVVVDTTAIDEYYESITVEQ